MALRGLLCAEAAVAAAAEAAVGREGEGLETAAPGFGSLKEVKTAWGEEL